MDGGGLGESGKSEFCLSSQPWLVQDAPSEKHFCCPAEQEHMEGTAQGVCQLSLDSADLLIETSSQPCPDFTLFYQRAGRSNSAVQSSLLSVIFL